MTNWLLDTMVSMTILMALVLVIRKPVSRFFGPHIAYLLWALPLARLFMPTLTIKVSAPDAGAAAEAPLLAGITNNISGNIGAQSIADQTAAMSILASIDWAVIALAIWIGGAGLLFISKLAGYFQFREDIISDGRLVGRHGRIKIIETAAVGGPLAFGLLEKYIAVPANFYRDYAPRERELALDHEISHHETGDLAANFIGLGLLSLHWFNPVAWAAWAAFRQDQETACDARVLEKGGRNLRAVYGRTIAKSVSGRQLGLASPLNQKNKIKDRLIMLGQDEKSTRRKRMGALMVGAGTALALPLTATVTYAVETEAEPVGQEIAALPLHVSGQGKAQDTEIAAFSPHMPEAPLAEPALPVAPAAPPAPVAPTPPLSAPHIADAMPDKEEMRNIAQAAAEQARTEVKEKLKTAELARHDAQQEARRELNAALAEARREIHEAQREAHKKQREAMAAAREAQHQAFKERGMAARVWEISQITFRPFARSSNGSDHQSDNPGASGTADCVAMNRKITFSGTTALAWTYVEANIVGCPQTSQPDAEPKPAFTVAFNARDNVRTGKRGCPDKDDDQNPLTSAMTEA